jgi:hypothetical protein
MNYFVCIQAPGVEAWAVLRSFDDVKKSLIASAKTAAYVDEMKWEQMSFYDKIEYVKIFLRMMSVQKIGYDDETVGRG